MAQHAVGAHPHSLALTAFWPRWQLLGNVHDKHVSHAMALHSSLLACCLAAAEGVCPNHILLQAAESIKDECQSGCKWQQADSLHSLVWSTFDIQAECAALTLKRNTSTHCSEVVPQGHHARQPPPLFHELQLPLPSHQPPTLPADVKQ